MSLNIKALKEVQDDLDTRSGGDNLFLYSNKLTEETDVRILPPLKKMNGMYFREQIVYWINKKPYLSPATFGKQCPIEQEVQEAKALAKKDKDLQDLIDDSEKFSRKFRYLMPILLLDCEFNDKGEATKVDVVDGAAKVLVSGPELMKAINRVITSRNFQNGTDDGILDRVQGNNMLLGKKGKGLDTKYTAEGWRNSTEMKAVFYQEDKIPDVMAITEKELKSDDYLRSVIRNYFYGEPIIKDEPAKNEPPKEEEKSSSEKKNGRSRGNSETTDEKEEKTSSRRNTGSDEKADGADETSSRRGAGSKRSLIDDLDNIGDS
jgi:hypothetical protein